MRLSQEEKTCLETMIDGHSFSDVLQALANIAYGKSEHLMENWRDSVSAKYWQKAGQAVQRVLAKIEV